MKAFKRRSRTSAIPWWRRSREELERSFAQRTDELAIRTDELAVRTSELDRAEQRFRAIVDASPVPLMISRLEDGTIQYANSRLEDLIGTPAHELIGKLQISTSTRQIGRQ